MWETKAIKINADIRLFLPCLSVSVLDLISVLLEKRLPALLGLLAVTQGEKHTCFSFKLIEQSSSRESTSVPVFLFRDDRNEDLNGALVQRSAPLLQSSSGFSKNLGYCMFPMFSGFLWQPRPLNVSLTADLVWECNWMVCVCVYLFIHQLNVWFSPSCCSGPSHHPQWCRRGGWAPLNWTQNVSVKGCVSLSVVRGLEHQ